MNVELEVLGGNTRTPTRRIPLGPASPYYGGNDNARRHRAALTPNSQGKDIVVAVQRIFERSQIG